MLMDSRDHDQLVSRLRQALDLSEDDVSDDELLRGTEGDFTRARIELGLAVERLGREIVTAFWQQVAMIRRWISR